MLLETIQYCEFLRGIPNPMLERLSQFAEERNYSAGALLFAEGAPHREFHVIIEGHVRLDMHVPHRGRVPILSAGPGDILAWSSLVGNSIMTSTGVALIDVKTITFASEKLIAICESESEVGFLFMRQLAAALSRRLVATRLQLLDLFECETARLAARSDLTQLGHPVASSTSSFSKTAE